MINEKRLPYAALKSEGQHACVIGPNDDIIVEIVTEEPDNQQMLLAIKIAALLNEMNDNHICNDRARQIRARHLLLLARTNGIREAEPLEILAGAIDEAGVAFNKAEIEEFVGTPF